MTEALGVVHRGVGAAEHVLDALVALFEQRDADAGRDVDDAPVERGRRDQRLLNPRDGRVDRRRVGAVVEQHAELIAADAPDDVARPHGVLQAVRDDAQHRIAGQVAQRVVDLLEIVEVEEQHRAGAVGRVARLDQRELRAALERTTGSRARSARRASLRDAAALARAPSPAPSPSG